MTSASGADLSNSELLTKLVELIKKESNNIKTEIKQDIQEIKIENAKILERIKQQEEKIEQLEQTNKKLQQENLYLERATRKNNILVFGLEVNSKTAHLVDVVTEKLNNLLGINISQQDLRNLYVIQTKEFPVKVEFISYYKKQEIFQNVYKLKNSKVFVVHDLCEKDRQTNKILQNHRKAAKAKNIPAKIIGDRLIVNGDTYTVDMLEANNQSIPTTPSDDITEENEDVFNKSTNDGMTSTAVASTYTSSRPSTSPGDKPPTKKSKQDTSKQMVEQLSRKTRLQSQTRGNK
nr:unnamed protein product [Callosobruchus analis]